MLHGTTLLEKNNGYWRESVILLQFNCKRLPALVLIDMRKILYRRMFSHSNVILHNLAVECRKSIAANADCYNMYDIIHGSTKIKKKQKTIQIHQVTIRKKC